MEVNVVNVSGKETGAKAQLSDAIFGIEPNDHAIYLDVKMCIRDRSSVLRQIRPAYGQT